MDIDKAFNDLQSDADADPDQVKDARERRQTFKDAFKPDDEVAEVFGSGSLARSTQRDPHVRPSRRRHARLSFARD